jgi:hypothetical protein
MTSTTTIMVDRDELETAFEFVSSGAPRENTATTSVTTGKIRWHSAMLGDMGDDDDPDDDDGGIAVPHKNDLDLGRRLVLRFVGEQMPRDYDTVDDYFRRRGAYGRFKDLLERRRKSEQWYEFEQRETQAALRAWCEDNGSQLIDRPPDAKRA